MFLETKRLYLRKLTNADYDDVHLMLTDPEVMYAYERDFNNSDVQNWIDKQLKKYRELGYGIFAVISKETGAFLGQAGFTIQECEGDKLFEIGYLLKKEFWHKGYATEAAMGLKEYAFDTLKEPLVHSIIRDSNIASQNVASRIGMKYWKKFIKLNNGDHLLHYVYRDLNSNKKTNTASHNK